jgi:hypothetical protein
MNIGSHLIAGSGVEFRQFLLDQKTPGTIGTPNGSGQLYFDTTAGTLAPWYYDGTSWMKWLRKDKAEAITQSWDFQIATGTSPITVTSTTKVTNFNADYLDDYHADSSANANTIAQRYTNGRLKVADPSDTQDAVNLGYMTAAIAGATDPKAAVLYTTAAALASYTYLSNVLTAVANGALSVDGQTPAVNDRIGVVYETGSYEQYNGIYVVTVVGDGATQWVMTRSSDADQDSEVTNGLQFWCTAGDTNNGSGWLLTTPDTIILNTTPLTFIQNNGTAQITAGNGIDKTGNVLSVLVNASTTYTPYGVLYHGSSSTLSATAAGTSNTVLHGNTGGAPTWSAVDLTADVSGILPVANGGTGFNTLAGAGIVTTAGMTTSPNTIPKATGSTVLSDSTITDDGTTVTINTALTATSSVVGMAKVNATGNIAYVRSIGGTNNPGIFFNAVESTGIATIDFSGSTGFIGMLALGTVPQWEIANHNLIGQTASTISTSSGALTLAPASGLVSVTGHLNTTADVNVYGPNSGSAANRIAMTMEGSGAGRILVNGTDVSTYGTFKIDIANASGTLLSPTPFFVSAAGNVGIGTTAPTAYGNTTTLAINNAVWGGRLDLMFAGVVKSSLSLNTSLNTILESAQSTTHGYDLQLISGQAAAGTDLDGGDVFVSGGASTGTGASAIYLQTATPGATGTGSNAATTKVIITGAGKVGIGATAPQALLHISSNSSPGVMISDTDAGADVKNYEFYTESGKAYIRRLTDAFSGYDPTITFDSSKVGIGTTTPSGTLDVRGVTYLGNQTAIGGGGTNQWHVLQGTGLYDGASNYGNYGGFILSANNGFTAAARRWLVTNALGATSFAIISSVDSATNPSLGTNGAITSGDARLVLTYDGKVGIGTTGPVQMLQVHGAKGLPASSGTTQNGLMRFSNTTDTVVLDIGTDDSDSGPWIQVTNSADLSNYFPLLLQPNGGNVGIGTTSPGRLLEVGVTGAAGVVGIARFSHSVGGNQRSWDIGVGEAASFGANDNFGIKDSSGGNTALVIDTSGNVGIGDVAPTDKLSIQYASAGSGGIGFRSASYASQARIIGIDDNTDGSGQLAIYTRLVGVSAEKVRITSAGYVGIGTASPGAKLDVAQAFSGTTIDADHIIRILNNYGTDTAGVLAGMTFRVENGVSNSRGFIGLSNNGSSGRADMVFAGVNSSGSATEYMRIKTGGNVGIGTTAPTAKLEIKTTGATTANLRLVDGNDRYLEIRKKSSDNTLELYNSFADKVILGATENGAYTYLMNGKVGIGTTTPSSPLTVLTGDSDGILIQGTTTVRPSLLFGNATTGLLCQQTVTNTADWALDVGVGAGVRAIQANAAGTLTLGASVGTITLGGSAYTTAGGILQVTGGVVSAPASIPTGTTIGSVAIARFKTVACVGDNTNEEIDVTHSLSTLSPVVTVWEADGSNDATAVAIVDVTPLSPLAVRLTFSSVQTTSDHYVVAFSG